MQERGRNVEISEAQQEETNLELRMRILVSRRLLHHSLAPCTPQRFWDYKV